MRKIAFASMVYVCCLSGYGYCQPKVTQDKDNVVSSRLEGEWEVNVELSKKMTGRSNLPTSNLIFQYDTEVVKNIPAKLLEPLEGKQIYAAGKLTSTGKNNRSTTFLVIDYKGNPHVVLFFGKAKESEINKSESVIVMLASGKEKKDDMLFIGGDFNNEPFLAYRRVK